jgi:peptidyl-dipeptidase Dcp
MKNSVVALAMTVIAFACGSEPENPLLGIYGTPFETPPFDRIRNEHFMPAFRKAMSEHALEIEAIVSNREEPTFENTVEALAWSGALLDAVQYIFNTLRDANTTEAIQKIADDVTPLLTRHRDDIALNEALFLRVKRVYERRASLRLSEEQAKLLDETYKNFVRGGAGLPAEQQKRFRNVNEELAALSLKFSDNLLKETNAFEAIIERSEELTALPQVAVDRAAEAAQKAGHEGKWVFTLHYTSVSPVLHYAKNRALRQKLYMADIMRGNNENAYDNKKIISRMAALRTERANLLGFKTHASYVLEQNMAKTPRAVYDFLLKLWEPALKKAIGERDEIQQIINKEDGGFALAPWDWLYYAEKVRKAKYDLDENELRPYFKLENVCQGIFEVARRLYGLQFIERKDIATYSDEVTVYEVKKENGAHLGIVYTDLCGRPNKRGCWCNWLRGQERRNGAMVTPLVIIVGSFPGPTGSTPALLSLNETLDLFHEFGHALNCLLQDQAYRTLFTPLDFSELPSQIMENWALEPEVLKLYARHYATGENLPARLVEKIKQGNKFNQGYRTVSYLSACFLDMDWHTLQAKEPVDVNSFEKQSLQKIGLIPEIDPAFRSTHFEHIWWYPYDAGYYSYIWAAVLDADAFEAFKEHGLFDRSTAKAFEEYVLAKGATDDAMKQYVKFRGKKPAIEPLLKRRGLM